MPRKRPVYAIQKVSGRATIEEELINHRLAQNYLRRGVRLRGLGFRTQSAVFLMVSNIIYSTFRTHFNLL